MTWRAASALAFVVAVAAAAAAGDAPAGPYDKCAEEHAGQSAFKGGETMGVGESKAVTPAQETTGTGGETVRK